MKRLTPATVTLIMLVVVGCLVAAYVAKNLLAGEAPPPENTTRNMPMAIAEIQPGTLISDDHLGLGPYPVSKMESDMLLVNRVIVGRVAREKIPAATPIRANQLYQPGEVPPLEMGEGMRAVSVEMGNSTSLVDGLIRPGNFVDVHFTISNNDERLRGGMTLRIFSGVRLLAINRNAGQARIERGGNRVTLELTPEQSNIMILAREKGSITLSYNPERRGDGGVAVGSEDRALLEEILGLKPLPTAAPPFVVETFQGPARGVLEFRDGRRIDQNDRARGLATGAVDQPVQPPARSAPNRAAPTQPDTAVQPAAPSASASPAVRF